MSANNIAREIGILDAEGAVDRDRLLDCLVKAFDVGRQSVLNVTEQNGESASAPSTQSTTGLEQMIILHVTSMDENLKHALTCLLEERGFSVAVNESNGLYFITAQAGQAALAPPPEAIAGSSAPAEMEFEIAKEISPESIPVPAPEPEELPVPTPIAPPPEPLEPEMKAPLCGTMRLYNLSLSAVVPFEQDPTSTVSKLYVQNMNVIGDSVSFIFGLDAFRYPVERASEQNASYINTDPQFTDSTIRILVTINDVDNIGRARPILLKLENGDECKVVLGTDLDITKLESFGDEADGKISAQ